MGVKNMMRKNGFTLLEVMIVLSIFALLVPAMFTMYFASLRAQRKVIVLRDAKRNGDNALTVMESLIKQNAISIHNATPPTTANEVCTVSTPTASGIPLYFKDKDGTWFSFGLTSNKIASASGTSGGSTSVNLTNSRVLVTDFDLRCIYISEISPPLVSISFDVLQSGPTGRPEDVASLTYQTKVKLRSY
jgi:prepilin-type N-terminal cleavage/methylation domain-containing protein